MGQDPGLRRSGTPPGRDHPQADGNPSGRDRLRRLPGPLHGDRPRPREYRGDAGLYPGVPVLPGRLPVPTAPGTIERGDSAIGYACSPADGIRRGLARLVEHRRSDGPARRGARIDGPAPAGKDLTVASLSPGRNTE